MEDKDNIELKIKFVQTDLTDMRYIYKKIMQNGKFFDSSMMYGNSGFISKLKVLNSYDGGEIVRYDNMCGTEDTVTDESGEAQNQIHASDYLGCCDNDDDYEYEEYYVGDEEFDEYSEDLEGGVIDFSSDGYEVEFITTGKMSVFKNQITISYDESELVGLRNATVNIMMDSKNPDIITIQKENFMKSTITLEKDKRSISDYRSNFPVAVKTLEMENNMTKKGGEINLLYTIEANGSPSEMVSYSLSARKREINQDSAQNPV